jgi:predicted transcriptional regulator
MKRSKDEIMIRILTVCSEGAGKTRVVYQSNLNFKTINPYLELLVKNGMIEIKEGQIKIYKTTAKGKELLKSFKVIQNSLKTRRDSRAFVK